MMNYIKKRAASESQWWQLKDECKVRCTDPISKQSFQLARSQTNLQCIIDTSRALWSKSASSLDDGCVALLDGVVDGPGGVADLTNLLVILVADLLLGGAVLGDVGVVTLLHWPEQTGSWIRVWVKRLTCGCTPEQDSSQLTRSPPLSPCTVSRAFHWKLRYWNQVRQEHRKPSPHD